MCVCFFHSCSIYNWPLGCWDSTQINNIFIELLAVVVAAAAVVVAAWIFQSIYWLGPLNRTMKLTILLTFPAILLPLLLLPPVFLLAPINKVTAQNGLSEMVVAILLYLVLWNGCLFCSKWSPRKRQHVKIVRGQRSSQLLWADVSTVYDFYSSQCNNKVIL
jgi:hypothetical protein